MARQSILLKTTRLTLRILDSHDADMIVQYLSENRDFIKEWAPSMEERFYSIEYQKQIINRRQNNEFKVYLFRKGKPNKIIGHIGVSNIIKGAFLSCYLGVEMLESETNKGYMTEALKAVITYIFEEIGLHRIEANVMPKNFRSKKLMERLDFVNEGLSRKYLNINNHWEDHERYVIWNKE